MVGSGSEFRVGGKRVWPGLRHEIQACGGLVVQTPDVCPRGHRLGPGEAHFSWSPGYCAHTMTCWACDAVDQDPADWVLVDPARQLRPDKTRGMGLELVVHPPASSAAAGRIEIRLDRSAAGHVDVALCARCRLGVLEDLHVEPPHRRYGLGRVLVAAALSRGPGYAWSSSSGEPAAFWAAIAPFLPAGLALGQRTGGEHLDHVASGPVGRRLRSPS
ncbi:hypothetical protein [Amycolatopsis sacchari]|uniref:hypothetical protein n=1 Tax=Amycolatopsis sacchari TaxID=115433 RepID=UPI003D762C23